jgi:TetR/AcrR family acrAB operon transcriptional repressor
MRRTKQEAEITRKNLLKAGLAVFSRRGYDAATLDDVAEEAGLTRGAIYWHFGSKAELYRALLEEYSAQSGALVQQAAAEGGSLAEVLRRIFVRLLAAVEEDAELRSAIAMSLYRPGDDPDLAAAQARLAQSGRSLLEGITQALRQGVERGELRADLDAAEMARAFLALQNGAVSLWLTDPESFSLKGSAPALAEIFLRGVMPNRE